MNEAQLIERFDAFRQPCTDSLGDGRVVKAGKTIAFVEGELFNEAGELLAKASSSARLVPRHEPA